MKKCFLMLTLFASLTVLDGCTGNAVYMKNDNKFTPTKPESIQVFSITEPAHKYEVIGYVSTYTSDAERAGDELRDNLKKQAAKFGANAIIGFKLNIGMGGGGGAQGVAVRYID